MVSGKENLGQFTVLQIVNSDESVVRDDKSQMHTMTIPNSELTKV